NESYDEEAVFNVEGVSGDAEAVLYSSEEVTPYSYFEKKASRPAADSSILSIAIPPHSAAAVRLTID
nr:hypothetical protein [Clostridia bacterium]